jgi:hypothetical protein
MLKDAVQAIYNKVQINVNDASPEELAYLSTSLEKLGGRATVYDVMDMGEDKKTEITVLAQSLIDGMTLDVNNSLDQFEIDVQAIMDLQTVNFNTLAEETESSFNAAITAANADLNDIVSTVQADVLQAQTDINEATANLTDAATVANQQAINGSFFNLYFYGTLQV